MAKPPFGGPQHVLDYVGRYTHRVAISNNRLLDIKDEQVRFNWKDYRDNHQKTMTLSAAEFMRRFLIHVLPEAFQRIRYYGFLRHRCRPEKLPLCRRLLTMPRFSPRTPTRRPARRLQRRRLVPKTHRFFSTPMSHLPTRPHAPAGNCAARSGAADRYLMTMTAPSRLQQTQTENPSCRRSVSASPPTGFPQHSRLPIPAHFQPQSCSPRHRSPKIPSRYLFALPATFQLPNLCPRFNTRLQFNDQACNHFLAV
jgi:hypothetical protein